VADGVAPRLADGGEPHQCPVGEAREDFAVYHVVR
jgi:hypothetical protein